MKAKRLFTFLIASVTLFVAASCNHKEEMEPTYDPGAVVFNVSSQAISDHGIDVVVRHNGKEKDGWNGFLTEDLTTPIEELILAQAVPVSKKDFHFGTAQTIRLTDLEAEKDYRYIAYGIKDDKTIYGIPGYAVFTTAEDFNIVVFNVELEEVTGHEAHFKVTHNGKDSYPWYAFATQDMESAIEDLVSAKSEEALDMLNRGASVTASLLELPADTEFRYIVFGIKENGAVYGTPAEVTFKTLEDFDGIQFTAKAGNITRNSAEITVSHDGREDYTWFGFLTEDLETSAAGLIEKQAASVTEADIQSGKDVKVTVEGLEEGAAYRYIVSGYKDGAVYGKPGVAEFTVEADKRTPYEKWLGTWEVAYGGGTDVWTISEKVKDVSYTIDGIEELENFFTDGHTVPIEAIFDSTTGDFSIKVQANLETVNLNTSSGVVETKLGLYGVIPYSGSTTIVTGNYTIVIASLNDDNTATLTGQTITLSSGGSYPIIGMKFACLSNNSYWNCNENSYYTEFPQTITQLTQVDGTGDGGGEGGGETSGYASFIGSWTDGTTTYTISQATENSTYTVSGFGIDITARYNNGVLEFFGQELGSDDNYTYYFYGVDQDNYLERGAQDGTNLLAKGTIGTDGALQIVGHEYVATYDGTPYDEIIVQLGIFGENADEDIYSFNNLPYLDLPATLGSGSAGAPAVSAIKVAKPMGIAKVTEKAIRQPGTPGRVFVRR